MTAISSTRDGNKQPLFHEAVKKLDFAVTPAKAGVQLVSINALKILDSGFRRNDAKKNQIDVSHVPLARGEIGESIIPQCQSSANLLWALTLQE